MSDEELRAAYRDEEMKAECLRIAMHKAQSGEDTIALAEKMYNWIKKR